MQRRYLCPLDNIFEYTTKQTDILVMLIASKMGVELLVLPDNFVSPIITCRLQGHLVHVKFQIE